MHKYIIGLAMALVIVSTSTVPTSAALAGATVYNESDAWAWTTAYSGGTIVGAWCTDPGKQSMRQFKNGVSRFRVEVTHKNCAHPVMLDRSVSSRGSVVAVLRGKNGVYAWDSQ